MDDNKETMQTDTELEVNKEVKPLESKEASETKPKAPPPPPSVTRHPWLKNKMTISLNNDTLEELRKVCPDTVENISQFVKWAISKRESSTGISDQEAKAIEQEMVRLRNENRELTEELDAIIISKQEPILSANPVKKVDTPVAILEPEPEKPKKSPNDFMTLLGY